MQKCNPLQNCCPPSFSPAWLAGLLQRHLAPPASPRCQAAPSSHCFPGLSAAGCTVRRLLAGVSSSKEAQEVLGRSCCLAAALAFLPQIGWGGGIVSGTARIFPQWGMGSQSWAGGGGLQKAKFSFSRKGSGAKSYCKYSTGSS